MAKRRPDPAALAARLRTPAFQAPPDASDGTPDGPPDGPLTPTTVVLRLEEIKPYEHNPRRSANPEYDRLKASIRATGGLRTPLTVSRRPGESRYVIAAGGNSRLQALQELVAETGDERLQQVSCRFEPWHSESRILAGHLIENDLRGNMTFIDKAQAVVQLRAMYQAQQGGVALTQGELRRCLEAAGWRVSVGTLNRYLYTVEQLWPHLPKLFASGLPMRQVEYVIRWRKVAEAFWQWHRPSGLDEDFAAAFHAACAAEDRHHEDWSVDHFRSALTVQLATALELEPKLVALDVDALYRGIPVAEHRVQRSQASEPVPWAFARARELVAERLRQVNARNVTPIGPAEPGAAESAPLAGDGPAAAASAAGLPEDADRADEVPSRIAQLRDRNYEVALKLAAGYGLELLVSQCRFGMGYFMDAPEPPAPADRRAASPAALLRPAPGHTSHSLTTTQWLWWVLCVCSEVLTRSHLYRIARLLPGAWLPELFAELPRAAPHAAADGDPFEALYLLVGRPNWLQITEEFLAAPELGDADRAALARLVEQCRQLHQLAADAGMNLWAAR